MMGVFASLLSGAAYGLESGNMVDGAKPGVDGQFFLAIDVGAFVDLATFKSRVDGVVRQLRSCRPAPGATVYTPGQIEAQLEADYRANGIPLTVTTLNGILRTAEKLGVDAAALAPT